MLLIFAVVLSGVFGSGFPDYTPYSYPDSITQSELCGQARPSLFCDPNNIVWRKEQAQNRTQDAYNLTQLLFSIRDETNCSCKISQQCDRTQRGYTVSVAVVEKMHLEKKESSREIVLEAAKIFADAIRDRQNRAQCDDDILIFLSIRDEVVWTSIGEAVDVDDDDVRRIAEQAEVAFRRMKYSEGLVWMVQQYKHVLKREKLEKFWSWSISECVMITVAIVILLILVFLTATTIYVCVKCCRKGRKDIYSVVDQQ